MPEAEPSGAALSSPAMGVASLVSFVGRRGIGRGQQTCRRGSTRRKKIVGREKNANGGGSS